MRFHLTAPVQGPVFLDGARRRTRRRAVGDEFEVTGTKQPRANEPDRSPGDDPDLEQRDGGDTRPAATGPLASGVSERTVRSRDA